MGRMTLRHLLAAMVVVGICLWLLVARATLGSASVLSLPSQGTTPARAAGSVATTADRRNEQRDADPRGSSSLWTGDEDTVTREAAMGASVGNATTLASLSASCPAVLYTPTFVTRIHSQFMVVDCWHHRVVATNGPLETPIEEWFDMDAPSAHMHKPLKIPHSVATDGHILVTESSVGGSDGTDHSLLVYIITATTPTLTYRFHQEVVACDVKGARRPHRVVYDSTSRAFFLYLTSPPFLAKFKWDAQQGQLVRVYCQSLPFMKGMYARSIVIQNGSLYITAGPGVVWQTAMQDNGVVRGRAYPIRSIGFTKGKMNDLAWIDGWWYATSTVPCAMVRFRSLDAMHQHQKIHGLLGLCKGFSRSTARCLGGTPYFVTKVGDRIFVPYIFGCSGVVSFAVDPVTQDIVDVVQHWGSGWVENSRNLACRGKEW